MVSVVIQVQQKTLIFRLTKNNAKIEQKIKQKRESNHQTICLNFTQKYFCLNRKYSQLCTFIHEYSEDRCLAFLSIIVPYFIIVQCYMLYIVLFQFKSLPLILTLIFLIITLEFELFLLFLIKQCARVAKLNGAFEKLNKQFYLLLVFGDNFYGYKSDEKNGLFLLKVFDSILNLKKIYKYFKAQTLALNNRFKTFAFKLAGDYYVTQKTLPTVIIKD